MARLHRVRKNNEARRTTGCRALSEAGVATNRVKLRSSASDIVAHRVKHLNHLVTFDITSVGDRAVDIDDSARLMQHGLACIPQRMRVVIIRHDWPRAREGKRREAETVAEFKQWRARIVSVPAVVCV